MTNINVRPICGVLEVWDRFIDKQSPLTAKWHAAILLAQRAESTAKGLPERWFRCPLSRANMHLGPLLLCLPF